jgi:hypothetical protein
MGRVIAAHALVERKLNRIIYRFLSLRPVEARIAIREPRTTDRVDMIADLLSLYDLKVSTNLDALKQALDKCYKERDALAHGVWLKDEKTGHIFLRLSSGNWQPPGIIKKAKRRIDLEGREYSSDHAKETCRLILGAIDALDGLEREIAALAPSIEKSRRRSLKTGRPAGRAPKRQQGRRSSSPG